MIIDLEQIRLEEGAGEDLPFARRLRAAPKSGLPVRWRERFILPGSARRSG